MTTQSRLLLRRLAHVSVVALAAVSVNVLAPTAGAAPAPGPSPFVAPPATPTATFAGGTGSAEQLGASVALSANGDEALVGAPAANGGVGAVYVYAATAGTWSPAPVATITAPAGTKAEFGTSVALSTNGEVALIGAPGGGSEPSNDGAAYVYVESGTTWPSAPAATFSGPTGSGTRLGFSVALSADGETALVGGPVAGDGSAYLYAQSGGTWPSAPTFTFPGTDPGGEFGSSVALSANGEEALIGAPGAGTAYDGAAYLYTEPASGWSTTPTTTFPGPPGSGAELGEGVALSANGEEALIGAPGAGPSFDGIAYIYTESSGGSWPLAAPVTFNGPPFSDAWLGTSVALSANGQVALMGGPVAGDGGAYLFAESGGTWPSTATTTFTPPPGSPDQLGSQVALSADGEVAVMGDAPYTGGVAIDGDAYLYSAPPAPARAAQTITISPPQPSSENVGATYVATATASSGLPVAFSIGPSSTAGACSLSGKTVKFTGPGKCLIDANQAGDSAWAAAPQVRIEIAVHRPSPRISVVSSSATLTGGYLPVNLSCTDGPCSGKVELVKRAVILAEAPFSIKAAASATLRVKLTPADEALFAHVKAHPLSEELVVSVQDGAGATRMIIIS